MTLPRATFSRRLCARLIDALWIVPGGLLLWRLLAVLTDLPWGWQMATFALFASGLQLAVEPIFVSLLGASPGKALMGITVVDAASGHRPSYAAALGRTVKVVARGLGFWALPLTLMTLITTLRRARSGHGIPWDRDGADGLVGIASPRRPGRALWMMAAAVVPGWLVPAGATVLAFALIGAQGIDAGQEISRGLTGRWQWLHRLSGELITLDARWRVLDDRLSVRRGEWSSVFAFGVGETNRLMLDVALTSPFDTACASKKLAMEDEGFVFFHETKSGRDVCVLKGGKPSRAGVVLVRIDGHRSAAGDHTLALMYLHADEQARVAVPALAQQLTAELHKPERWGIRDRRLVSHWWRNDLTGATARIPGDWELRARTVNANGSISFVFDRVGDGAPREDAAIIALPWAHFDTDTDPHEELEKALFSRPELVNPTRRVLSSNETVTNVHVDSGSASAWTRRDRLRTWAASWSSAASGPQPAEPTSHPLLRELHGTMR